MNCSDTRQKLSEYLDGELSERDGRLVREHLDACGDCRAELRELERTVKLVRQTRPAELRGDLLPGIRERLERPERERTAILRFLSLPQAKAALAACVVLSVCAYVVLVTDSSRVSQGKGKDLRPTVPAATRTAPADPAKAAAPVQERRRADTDSGAAEILAQPVAGPGVSIAEKPAAGPGAARKSAARSLAPAMREEAEGAAVAAAVTPEPTPAFKRSESMEADGRLWGDEKDSVKEAEPAHAPASPALRKEQTAFKKPAPAAESKAETADEKNAKSRGSARDYGYVQMEQEDVAERAKQDIPVATAAAMPAVKDGEDELNEADQNKAGKAAISRQTASVRVISISGADTNKLAVVLEKYMVDGKKAAGVERDRTAIPADGGKAVQAAEGGMAVTVHAGNYDKLLSELRKIGAVTEGETGDKSLSLAAGSSSRQTHKAITVRITILRP